MGESPVSGQTRGGGRRDDARELRGEAHGELRGDVRFVSVDGGEYELPRPKTLVVRVHADALEPGARGRLADAIDAAIERELAARGAPARGLGAAEASDGRDVTDVKDAQDVVLSDQLFRARQLGARGITIVLGGLDSLCARSGPLEAADARTLTFLADATRERPVSLLLDAANRALTALAPIALPELLGVRDANANANANDERDSAPVRTPAPPARADAHVVGASISHAIAEDDWRHWTLQLTAARGAQPLAALERLFAQSYMPLTNAIAAGLDDPRAVQAQDEFRRGFEKSYGDAFPTFAVTGKRPRMVLDAPEIAGRVARLHGARATQLLLVDSMRWDIGMQVKERLITRFGSRASLAEELVLWSALPTTTARQLDTLARGLEALRPNANGTSGLESAGADASTEAEAESLRGRTASIVRRLRIGRRDLYKLDLITAKLAEPGGDAARDARDARDARAAADAELADAVATVVLKHTESLGARTLLFIFGDHGFVRAPAPAAVPATAAVRRRASPLAWCPDASETAGAGMPVGAPRGGACGAPEEVLVPAFAFLVGEMH